MSSSSNNYYPYNNGHKPSQYPNSTPDLANPQEHDDEIDLLKLASVLLKNKWILIAFLFTFSSLAAVISLQVTPLFESSGTIFISESKNRYSYAGSDLSNLLTTTYGIGMGSTIANEIAIIKSRTLSEQLADSLLRIELTENGYKFPLLWKDYPDDSTNTTRDVVAARIRNTLTAEKIDQQTDIVKISFESPLPEEAAFMANLTMNTYSQLSTQQNKTMATSALDFLEDEKVNFEKQLRATEDSLQNFMDKTGLIAVNSQVEELISLLADIRSKRQDFSVKLVAVESGIESYENQLDEIKPGLSDQISEGFGSSLERYQYMLSELITEKFLILSKNPDLEQNPNSEIRKINDQIKRTRKRIKSLVDEIMNSNSTLSLTLLNSDGGGIGQQIISINQKLLNLRIEQSQYSKQIEVLNERYEQLNDQFESLPEETIQLARFKRDVKINEQLYLLVSNQYAEMTLWERTQFGMGRPLDYAIVPDNPVWPRKILWVAIGFLLGGVFGVGVIFIKNAMDDSIDSADDLKKLGVPQLGNIPDFDKVGNIDTDETQIINDRPVSNQLLTLIDHISPISEAYRRIRINIVYANPDNHHKVFMVTSSNKGEGKSTFVSNLAITFAEAEKRVLIVDLDLRRPTIHKVFGEDREPGLVEALFDQASLEKVIKPTVMEGVDVITVGKKTPEPASVLDSQRLKKLIDEMKQEYDHVILDTAPYGIISDSASLLRLVDGVILLARFNRTSKRELQFTLDGLHQLNAEVIGTVLNGFDPAKSSDYYYNYNYYKRAYKDYYKESYGS